MKRHHIRLSSLAMGSFVVSLLIPTSTNGQIAASEFSTISQTIDGTVISMEYSRPSRRDRDSLFGGVMAYGEVITPGANMATNIEFSRDVKLDGHEVPAGKYSVWISFEESGWELGLDETWQRFHGPHPVMEDMEIRIPLTPREVAMEMETLTFHFPAVRTDGATLRLHWGTTAVEMDLRVEPTPLVNIEPAAAQKFVGKYAVNINEKPPWTMFSGTGEIELTYENEFLHTVVNIGPYTDAHDMAFFPKTDEVLFPVLLMDGAIAQSFEGGVLFEFNFADSGAVIGFEARFPDDSVWISGTKID